MFKSPYSNSAKGEQMKKLLYPLLLVILILTAGCDSFDLGGNEPPVAYIDSISPSSAAAGETVTFVGHGTDADGTIVGYKWRSDIDGDIGSLATFESPNLSEGEHTIYLAVQDNNDAWSEEVESIVMVGAVSTGSAEEGAFESEPEATPETGTPTALPYINYLTAEPAIIPSGGSSIIRWSASNAESVTGSYDSTVVVLPTTGSATVRPTRTTTYTVAATSGASTVSATVTVAVEGGGSAPAEADLPVINSFTASPATISAGGSLTLNWDVSNATIITLAGGTKTSTLTQSAGSTSVSPTSTTTYTLTATNAAGSTDKTATVTVQAPAYKTKELPIVTAESGSVSSDHVAGTKLITGDSGANKGLWAYFSFNISTLAGKEIAKAELIYPPSDRNGNPWPDLGLLGIYQDNHGPRALKGSDFIGSAPTIARGLGQGDVTHALDVTSQVRSAAAARASRFQVSIHFNPFTDFDEQPDNISWTTTSPKLRIQYR
jgi:hypothetical protein